MKDALLDVGLSETEAEIYLQLVKKGSLTAVSIAKEIKVHRRTIYDNLNILLNKGLVTYHLEDNVKYFQANDPAVLKEREEEKLDAINKILPTLNTYYSTPRKNPQVEVFKGLDAVKTLLYDMQETDEGIRWLGGGFKLLENLTVHKKKIARTLATLSLKIIQPKPEQDVFTEYFSESEIRFVNHGYATGVAFFIYGDTVITGSIIHDDFFVIRTQDAAIAQAYKNIFEMLWKASKV